MTAAMFIDGGFNEARLREIGKNPDLCCFFGFFDVKPGFFSLDKLEIR